MFKNPFKPKYKYPNTRQWPRVRCFYATSYIPDSQKEIRIVYTKDLSVGGALLVTTEELAAGTPLRVEVEVTQLSRNISSGATVIRQTMIKPRHFETGVKFTGLTDKDKKDLDTLITSMVGQDKGSSGYWRKI